MSRDIHTVELLTQVFPFDSSMKLDIIKEGSVSLSATKSEMPNTRCKIITDQMASLLKSAATAGSTRHRLGPANLLPHWQTFKKRENYIANDQFSDFAFLNVFYANVVCVANNVKLKHFLCTFQLKYNTTKMFRSDYAYIFFTV